MAKRNIEIKAICANHRAIVSALRKRHATGRGTVHQVDTYFVIPRGRLKLRTMSKSRGELIYYDRPNRKGPKLSQYHVFRTDQPAALTQLLSDALGVLGVVKKKRTVYLLGQTRVHLDTVVGLGNFIELEVVLRPSQTVAEGGKIASGLLEDLGIADCHLLLDSYIDMILRNRS